MLLKCCENRRTSLLFCFRRKSEREHCCGPFYIYSGCTPGTRAKKPHRHGVIPQHAPVQHLKCKGSLSQLKQRRKERKQHVQRGKRGQGEHSNQIRQEQPAATPKHQGQPGTPSRKWRNCSDPGKLQASEPGQAVCSHLQSDPFSQAEESRLLLSCMFLK